MVRLFDLHDDGWREVSDAGALRRVHQALLAGLVVAMPCDTVYGLVAVAESREAVQRVAAIKLREPAQPPPVLVPSVASAFRFAMPLEHEALAAVSRLWPGPLSVVVEAVPRLFRAVNPSGSTVALRVPAASGMLGKLLLRYPLVASSANLHGEETATDGEGVLATLASAGLSRLRREGLALVVGGSGGGMASTVIALQGGVRLIREGDVSFAAIARAISGPR